MMELAEQVTEQPAVSPEATASAEAAKSAALAVLEKAMQEEAPKEAAPEETEAKEAPAKAEAKDDDEAREEPAKEDPAKDPPPPEESKIAAVMRARRQAQRVREDAETQAQARLREVEEREAKLVAREKGIIEELRSKPIEALRKLGIDTRDFFEKAVKDPEELDPAAQLKAEIEGLKQQQRELAETLKQEREQARQASREEVAQQVRAQFVRETFDGDKYPTVKAFYEDRPGALVSRAESLVRECARRGLDPAELQNSEIAAFLESELQEEYNTIKSRLERVGSAAASQPADRETSLTTKLTNQRTGRRKKTLDEMSESERRAEALRVLEDEMEGRVKTVLP